MFIVRWCVAMRFTVSIYADKFRKIFKIPSDYIDVYVTQNMVLFFAETTDIFSSIFLPIDTIVDFKKSVLFRIPKSGFLSLLGDGIVSFLCDNSFIYVNINTKGSKYNMKFERQICSIQSALEKIKIILTAKNYPTFPASDLVLPAKLLRTSAYPLSIINGYIFSTIGSMQMYAKSKCGDCAIFPAALNFLLANCSDFSSIFDVRNFIIYTDGFYNILIKKAVSSLNSDIDYILKQKVIYKSTIIFGNALHLLSKVRDYTKVDLNLRKQELILYSGNCEFSTKIELVSDESATLSSLDEFMSSEIEEIPTVQFPAEVFKNIIYVAKSKKLKILCTKSLIRIEVADGLMFVCHKGS